jgi:outer membrane protein TolC
MEGKMSKNLEPDGQFVDRLEWQLASEFRRMNRLKPAAGKVAVPRYVVALSLAAGVLLMGVAATKAADLIKDSWRKKIEVARLETEVKIKRAFLDHKKEAVARAETQVSMGLIHEDDALVSKLGVERAASDLERSLVDLEEVKASGETPRNELYAPAVGGRDFVSERLEIDKRTLEADLGLRRTRSERHLKEKVDLGLIPKSELDDFQASLATQEAGIGDIEKRLDLRRQFLAGKISAEELEIQDRTTAAEKDLRQAKSLVDSIERRLELLRAKQAVGMISETEIRGYQFALDTAQAELSLALQQIEILKKLK